MKYTTIPKIILLTFACAGLGMASAARAAHASTFFDPLVSAIDTRLADEGITAAETRALTAAQHLLNRNTKTLSADASLLASVSRVLAGESEVTAIVDAENGALNAFVNEANGQLGAVEARATVGDNPPPRAVANQISQASAALDRASSSDETLASRAKAAAFALNKIRVADQLASRLVKAPASLAGESLVLTGRESDREAITITLNDDGTYVIPARGDEPEETGAWTYERTSASTGTVTLSTSAASLDLKFASATRGAFTGTVGDETARGRFVVQH